MYQKGDLRTHVECAFDGSYCEAWKVDEKHRCCMTDERNNYADVEPGMAYLPHSCEQWIVGGKDQIRALIDDLTALL